MKFIMVLSIIISLAAIIISVLTIMNNAAHP